MAAQEHADLPSDALILVARAALAAEGHGLTAWTRLSSVCRAWRNDLRGAADIVLLCYGALSMPLSCRGTLLRDGCQSAPSLRLLLAQAVVLATAKAWLYNHVRRLQSVCPSAVSYSIAISTGVPVNVVFRTKMTAKQRMWLQGTDVPLQGISFRRGEPASHVIVAPVRAIVRAALCDCVLLHMQIVTEVRTGSSMDASSIYT